MTCPIGYPLTYKELFRIMADDPTQQEPAGDTPEALKALRRELANYGGRLDQVEQAVVLQDRRTIYVAQQVLALTVAMAATVYALKRVAKEIPNGTSPQ